MKRIVAPLPALEALNDPLEIIGAVHDPEFPFAS